MNNCPRTLTAAVERMCRVMPVVVVTGARQTGKSTLVRRLLPGDRTYLSLDELDVLAQAQRTPDDLVARDATLVLDEVQRAPDLLLAVKRAVDAERRPGRFVLTGSANLLLMRGVSESLAGRAGYLTLWPLSRREVKGLGVAGRWQELFDHPVEEWAERLSRADAGASDFRDDARRGGYPVPAIELASAEDREIWLDGYVRTYLERDLQELSSIDNLVDFRRLMRAVCLRLGNVINQSELGRDVGLPQPTVRRWLNLLETSYQFVPLPAYARNRTKRLIKSPKAYWCDTALALRLAGTREAAGAHLENMVLADLLVWRDASIVDRPEIFYWRTTRGDEVDFVVERSGQLVAIEVKAGGAARSGDARGVVTFREEYGDAVRGALILHAGDRVERLGRGIVAVPWWKMI